MINVDLIYSGEIFSQNGASTVVRLLYDSQDIFNSQNVSCSFYSSDVIRNEKIINSECGSSSKEPNQKDLRLIKKFKKFLRNIIFNYLPNNRLVDFFKIYLTYILGAKKIAIKFCNNYDVDTKDPVFIHDIFTSYYYLRFTKSKRPILLVLHNNGETFKMLTYYYPKIKNSWVMRYLERMENFVLGKVGKIVFVSSNSATHFINTHPNFAIDKVTFVYNGIPDKKIIKNRIKDLPQKYELCCVGSITDRKGQEIIIEALGKLNDEQRSKLHLTFIGDGYLRKKLEERVEKLGLQENVSFAGNQNDVDAFLIKSDIFILTSFDEGLPMAIIEAQRAKLPIISTKVAGIPEMIEHKKSGLLINPDIDEVVDIFVNIDNYDWHKMGIRSHEIFKEKFMKEQMVVNYSSLLKSLKSELNSK